VPETGDEGLRWRDRIAATPGSLSTDSEIEATAYGRVAAALPAWKSRQRGRDVDATSTRLDATPPLSTALAIIMATASSGETGVAAPAAALLAVWAAAALAAGLRGARGFDVFSWRSVLLPSLLERPG
jgi:hypothetical protein